MSKYSDRISVGGQVLAHRFRMMNRNWSIFFSVGKISFLLSFIFNIFMGCKIWDVWNYFCILKAICFSKFNFSLFNKTCLWFSGNKKCCLADNLIIKNEIFLRAKEQFENFLLFDLKVSFFISLGLIGLVAFVSWCFGKFLTDKKELLFGDDYVDAKVLKGLIKDKSDISLAGINYPKDTESRHTIILGTTGAGKTTVFHELIRQIIDKGDRAIIVDTVGTFVDDYYNYDRDILLNPLDKRSVPWSLFEECGNNLVVLNQVADCFVRKKSSTDSFWDNSAKIVLIDSLQKNIEEGKSEKFLLKMLQASTAEWQEMLSRTPGAGLMDKEAEKMAISIRATMINDLTCLGYLKLGYPGQKNFGIKKWVESGDGILFLSCTTGQRAALISLISSWLTIAAEALLQSECSNRKTWFIIDEFHNLGRLPRFETYLAEVRKFGGCFVLGTQMVSQLNNIYSREVARSIAGLCGTKVIMNVPEPVTAKYMSEFLGRKEEVSVMESISYGGKVPRDGMSVSQQKEKRDIVEASEIMGLKIGEAFIRFSGIPVIGKVQFEYKDIHLKI